MVEEHRIEVDGELFLVHASAHGGTDYDWISGPNAGYGFSSSGGARTDDEHAASIRIFLSMIDPVTGFIGD